MTYHGPRIRPIIERFWEKVYTEPNCGCWMWAASLNGGGYGQIYSQGDHRPVLAHRFAYLHFRGPIPDGLEPDHQCRMTWCVNPWHLELVTRKENYRRGSHYGAVLHRTQICRRGHQLTVENVYQAPNGGQRCKECMTIRNRRRYPNKLRGPVIQSKETAV